MASYKDSPNLKFSPYVQTLPVEAMAKVGMYKQQRYDQGVQKIQQSIDNIAGLDIVRPEDKQYLQSKLNQLGSQLSSVAGGDFSNFALVNSVNGMTNQIAKDPGVINAVSNTARYKKDLATVDKLNSEGKWAPSNQAAFQKDVNKWFQGGQDAIYRADVSPYVDVTKDATDIIKALAKKFTQDDVAVEQDANGKFVVYNAITRRRVEGISKERIASALQSGLSPQAMRQLSIDGMYKYSGTSPDKFISDINSNYQDRFQELTTKRKELVAALPNVSPSQQTKMNDEIEAIDNSATSLKKEYDSISSGFQMGEVENAQAQYYTMNWLQSTANAYETKSTSRTFHTNPFKTQENFERKMQQLQDNSDRDYRIKMLDYNRKVRKDKQEQQEQQEPFADLTIPVDSEGSGVERSNTQVMMDALTKTQQSANDVDSIRQQLKNLNFTDKGITEAMKNPSAEVDKIKRDYIIQLKNAIKENNRLNLRDDAIEKAAKALYELPDKDELIATIPNNKNFIYGGDGTGGLLYHTIGDGNDALDVFDLGSLINMFDNDYKSNVSGSTSFGATSSYRTYPKEEAKKRLTPLQYKLYEMYIDPDKKQVDVGYNTLNNSNILDRNQFNNFIKGARAVQRSIKEKLDQQNDWMAEQYVNQEQVNLVKTSRINKDNFENVRATLGQFITFANSAESGKLSTGLSAEEIKTVVDGGIESASVFTDQTGNDQQGFIINGAKLPLPAKQFEEVTRGQFKPSPQMQYYNDKILPYLLNTLPEVIQNPKGEPVAKDRGYYTTSVDGAYDTTTFNAQYSTSDGSFPQLKNSYKAWMNFNSVQDPNSSETIQAQMLVMDPLDMELKTLNFTVTPEKASEIFDLRSPSTGLPALEQLIYETLNADKIINNQMPKNINDATIQITTNKVIPYKTFLKQQSEQYGN